MKIVVIGAGISGRIAAATLDSEHDVLMVDAAQKKHHPFADHKAILRLRSDDIKKFFQCTMKEILAHKQVLHKGVLYDSATIDMNNCYSQKCYGSVSKRSIYELGIVKRYIVEYIQPEKGLDICFNKKVVKVSDDRQIHFPDGSTETYDFCVSTMPMPSMLNAAYGSFTSGISRLLKSRPVFIKRCRLSMMLDKHRTIYFTQPDFPYRATLEECVLIIESMRPVTDSDTAMVADAFGFKSRDISSYTVHKKNIGKILPFANRIRKQIIDDLTNRFNIYSLGRFAIWKPIRVDHVIDDMKTIACIINDILNRHDACSIEDPVTGNLQPYPKVLPSPKTELHFDAAT
jgi:hypothetical protein